MDALLSSLLPWRTRRKSDMAWFTLMTWRWIAALAGCEVRRGDPHGTGSAGSD
jgi:hypothetical protein